MWSPTMTSKPDPLRKRRNGAEIKIRNAVSDVRTDGQVSGIIRPLSINCCKQFSCVAFAYQRRLPTGRALASLAAKR
jgi:hypothetical protein